MIKVFHKFLKMLNEHSASGVDKSCFLVDEVFSLFALGAVHPTRKLNKQLQKNAFASILVPIAGVYALFSPFL
tara:strand:- start:680 stop:898 length:219 start_codon:yes stop_codon:yes gene_type:complete